MEASRDTIDSYIAELEAIKNYDRVKQERDEALKKADPVELLRQILDELYKPEKEQVFHQDVKDSGIVEKIRALLRDDKEQRAYVHSWFEKHVMGIK